ncbi:hypothetical protein J8J14_11905 [Roseomonas sp. SSH11]|uniref:Lipoprotein n=1 Tax=Pararoseomonas baculiformis TaxID=2820812 RepID=A0ABS4AEP4_9PROT|nr:hypothetical protein [Pararoseomonas baculiformis]MBP0445482.1 hypothetical protein [Pararoseomonas baculiformis]
MDRDLGGGADARGREGTAHGPVRRMRAMLLGGPALLLLVGCARTEMISLRHPGTGQVTRCEAYLGSPGLGVPESIFRRTTALSCPADYQAEGWQRLDQPG